MATGAMLSTPEIVLTQEEAEKLSNASAKAMSHFTSMGIAQKYVDIIALAAVAGSIYAPRVMAVYVRKTRQVNGGPKLDDDLKAQENVNDGVYPFVTPQPFPGGFAS